MLYRQLARYFSRLGLAEVTQQFGEPGNRGIECLAARDPLELDYSQFVASLLVLPHHARLAAKRCVHCVRRAVTDQRKVSFVRGGRASEVAALLDEHFVGAKLIGELPSEPLARVY